MKIKNINLSITVILLFTVFYSCDDKKENTVYDTVANKDESGIAALLEKAGHLYILNANRDLKRIEDEKSDVPITFKDPLTGNNYNPAYAVKRTKTYECVYNSSDFIPLEPWDMIWPGNLIQGKSFIGENPEDVPLYKKRRPAKIYLSLADLDENMDNWYKEVPMNKDVVSLAKEELATEHFKKNRGRIDFQIEKVSSPQQIGLLLGLNLTTGNKRIIEAFGNNWDPDKSYVAVKLNQLFYNLTYEPPEPGYKGFFTNDITSDELKNYTFAGNPICYVHSVTYGRSYILLYESTENDRNLELAVNSAFAGQKTYTHINRSQIFNNATCKVLQVGENTDNNMYTIFSNYDKTRAFIEKGTVLSVSDFGVPISCKLLYLNDNSEVILSNLLNYKYTSKTYSLPVSKNNITIDILNIKMSVPQSKYAISNHSTMTLKSVNLYNYYPNGSFLNCQSMINGPITFYTKDMGADIPIYQSVQFSNAKGHKIRIEAEFYIKNETYNNNDIVKEEGAVKLTQDFNYASNIDEWWVGENNSFEYKSFFKQNFGGASVDITLNYRFSLDGKTYPKLASHN